MFKKLLFGLNWLPFMAADDGLPGGNDDATDDDLEDLDEDDLKALLEPDKEDDSDDPEQQDDEGEEDSMGDEGDEGKKTKTESEQKKFTQEDLERIIGERLARERKTQEEKAAQEKEAQKQKEELDQWWETKYQEQMKIWVDLGYEEEVAAKLAGADVAKEYRLWQAEERIKQYEQQQKAGSKTSQYVADRAAAIAKNPMAARYIQEIDDFAQNGTVLDFQTAMKFVLGDKLASGELMDIIKTTTEQKTLANVDKRAKKSVEKGGSGASSGAGSLSREERLMAKRLGVSEKVYAANKKK